MLPSADVVGFFDWPELYDRVVSLAPPDSILVEVGVFFGKSLIHLATRAKEADKGLRVVGVDGWRGSKEFDAGPVLFNGRPINEAPPGFVLASCFAELAKRDLLDITSLVVCDSAKAAALFADASVFMAYIDAAHDEESVDRDIRAWWPKVIPGGFVGGHDYQHKDGFPGVKKAVDALFGEAVTVEGRSWGVVR